MLKTACVLALPLLTACIFRPTFDPTLFKLDARRAGIPVMLSAPRQPVAPGRVLKGEASYHRRTVSSGSGRYHTSYDVAMQSTAGATDVLLGGLAPGDRWLQCKSVEFGVEPESGTGYDVKTSILCEAQP